MLKVLATTGLVIALVFGGVALFFGGAAISLAAPPRVSPPKVNIKPFTTNYFAGAALHHYCGTSWTVLSSDAYVPSNGTTHCNDAIWDMHSVTQGRKCDVSMFIPYDYQPYIATASVYLGVFDSTGTLLDTVRVDEKSPGYGYWTYVGSFSNIHHIYLADNNGQTGTEIGVSTMLFAC